VILKSGEKIAELSDVAGDYEDWIARGLGLAGKEPLIVNAMAGEPLPPVDAVQAVVITGSGAMVTDHSDWIEAGAAWLREVVQAGAPVFGICFGHQWLGYALGGEVGYNPNGVEVGSHPITLTGDAGEDALFAGMPERFMGNLTHRQSVLRLPPGARRLAGSALEPNQAFAYGECVWGVQFHPEFDAQVIAVFIEYYRERLMDEGKSADALLQTVVQTPESAALLGAFARLVEGRSSRRSDSP